MKINPAECLFFDACGLRKTVRYCRGNCAGRWRFGEGRVLRVDRVGVIRAEVELLQRPRVRHQLGLPALVGLILLHGCPGSLVPFAVSLAGKIMRADESLLNLCDPARLHRQLAARLARFGLSFARSVGSLGAMRRGSVCLRGARQSAVRLRSVRLSSMRLSAVRLPGVLLRSMRRWFAAGSWMSGGTECRLRRQSREHCQRQAGSKSQHAGSPLRRQFLANSYIDSLAICPVLQQVKTPIGIWNTKACGKGAGSGTSPLAPPPNATAAFRRLR